MSIHTVDILDRYIWYELYCAYKKGMKSEVG